MKLTFRKSDILEDVMEKDEQFMADVEAALMADHDALTLEKLRPGLLALRTGLYAKLCKAREQYRHPKDKDLTDFDRKTMLEASVANIQAHYEAAKGLEELVAERVDLLKLLMRIK